MVAPALRGIPDCGFVRRPQDWLYASTVQAARRRDEGAPIEAAPATPAPDLVFALRHGGSVLALGRAWPELTGMELNALRAIPWPDLVHPDDIALLRLWSDAVLAGGVAAPARLRIRTSDGSYRFIEVDAVSDADGQLIVGAARPLPAGHDETAGVLRVGDLELDTRARTVTASGHALELTVSEFELLKLLTSQRGTALRTDDIAREIWGYESSGSANFLQAHVSRLRRKFQAASVDDPVATVRGVGYIVR